MIDKITLAHSLNALSCVLVVGDIPSVGSVTSDGSGSFIPSYETMTLGKLFL